MKEKSWDEIKQALNEVSRTALVDAIRQFDSQYTNPYDYDEGWWDKQSYKYYFTYKAKCYPPKYIMSLATGIPTTSFYGGSGTGGVNKYLEREGFRISEIPR